MIVRWLVWGIATSWWAIAPTVALADEVDSLLATVAKAGPQGADSTAARSACDRLAEQGAAILPRLLVAMETTNPVAANWYRTVYERVVEREMAAGGKGLPVEAVRSFVGDSKHEGRVRRLALELCDQLEPGFSKKLIPRLLDDPEFRPDAVEAALAAGQQALESGDSETAREEFRQAFEHSRDGTQTSRAADKLTGLGEKVDIAAHLGLVVDWWLIGPFDAPRFSGFAQVFPPEEKLDLRAQYSGQEGRSIAWQRHHAADPLGTVNLIQALGPATEAVGYAYAEITSPREHSAELRCGADDNCTVWLNDQKVFSREQWLNGTRFDRFVAPVKLRRGANRVLVKICQGPQHKDPQVSNNWSLQLRFCDAAGGGVPFEMALPSATGEAK